MNTTTTQDLIDRLVPLAPGMPLHAVRHQRGKVVAATQGSDARLFDPALPGLTLAERLLVAYEIARLSESTALEAYYRERLLAPGTAPADVRAVLDGETASGDGSRLAEILRFARVLALRPVDGDRTALLRLPAAGLDTPAVVALAQLIAYVAYQVRVLAGLRAIAALDDGEAAPPTNTAKGPAATGATRDAPFVHPALLARPGEPLRINGFTSDTLAWRSWLPVLSLQSATPEQIAVLEASHPAAKTSDYYLVLVHQPAILRERSTVFNAIMYAPGGLPRAERELASTVVSRVNGCVYCASVHAQRFEQISKRNDVIAQVFTDPQGAGTTARERAIVDASIALTRAPARFGAAELQPLRAAGLSPLELLDLVQAIAIFAWANRLMLNLGEPA